MQWKRNDGRKVRHKCLSWFSDETLAVKDHLPRQDLNLKTYIVFLYFRIIVEPSRGTARGAGASGGRKSRARDK